jgi:endoglucanase
MLDGALNYMKQNNVSGTYWAGGPWWGTYLLSIEPDANGDKPQMAILSKYSNDKISSVQKVNSIAEVNIYPNPTTDNIRIISDAKIKSVSIFDNLGKLLFQKTINNQETQNMIPLSQFVSGNYVVKIILDDNRCVIKKVVKI